MPQTDNLIPKIFQIENDIEFNELSLEIFHYQIENNFIYRSFVENLSITTDKIKAYQDIPFMPVEFFKQEPVKTGSFQEVMVFLSSGTSGLNTSRHFVKDIEIYKKSFTRGFELVFGKPHEYIILALLPSYLERKGSSLIYMVDSLMETSNHPDNDYFLNNLADLQAKLRQIKNSGKKAILFGVTYALLDLVEKFPMNFPDLCIVETGGMKGRRKEMIRTELHDILRKGFGVQQVCSEYGMTELLSQAYSTGDGVFKTPPWMKILIRDMNDPFNILTDNKTGGINIIDLANIHSCAFIATQDLGKLKEDNSFEVLGRFDHSDIRGCNLMVD